MFSFYVLLMSDSLDLFLSVNLMLYFTCCVYRFVSFIIIY